MKREFKHLTEEDAEVQKLDRQLRKILGSESGGDYEHTEAVIEGLEKIFKKGKAKQPRKARKASEKTDDEESED